MCSVHLSLKNDRLLIFLIFFYTLNTSHYTIIINKTICLLRNEYADNAINMMKGM